MNQLFRVRDLITALVHYGMEEVVMIKDREGNESVLTQVSGIIIPRLIGENLNDN